MIFMRKLIKVRFFITREMLARVEKLSRRMERPRSAIIREALKIGLPQLEKELEVIERIRREVYG